MAQWQNYSDGDILKALHQCVQYSLVTYVQDAPLHLILKYLSSTPFFRGADQLYYLVLRTHGISAHYTEEGQHLVALQPELATAYVMAEQNINAPSHKNSCDSILHIITPIVHRMIISTPYANRMNTMVGNLSLETAMQIPRVAMCVPEYRSMILRMRPSFIIADVIGNTLNPFVVSGIAARCSEISSMCPELWNIVLKHHYHQELVRLNFRKFLVGYPIMTVKHLDTLFPDIVQFPHQFNVLCAKLWFADRNIRAYLLGYDLDQGCPSNESVSARLHHLNSVGVEKYVKEITGISMSNNVLTGYLGHVYYDHIVGKKLGNTMDKEGIPVGKYYPYDLIPLVYEDTVYMVPVHDFKVSSNHRTLTDALNDRIIPYLPRSPDPDQVKMIIRRFQPSFKTVRGVQAHQRLLDLMFSDSGC